MSFRTFINRLRKGEHYELIGQTIFAYHGPFETLALHRSEIKQWAIIPEMGVDFIQIELNSGKMLLLTDKHNDLIAALNAIAENCKVGDELELLNK